MSGFTEQEVADALEAKSARLTERDVTHVAKSRAAVEKLIADFPEQWAKARRQAGLLLELVSDATVALESRRYAAGALIYLGAPLDLVPDEDEDGFADDAAVVALAVRRCEPAVRTYCVQRSLNAAEFLD